jgi:hypothetical protein
MHHRFLIFFLTLGISLCAPTLLAGCVQATPVHVPTITPIQPAQSATATPKPTPHIATPAEFDAARITWSQSRHANTYDAGMGANTTCALCKSPRNYDPDALAKLAAEDCSACKREPGQPRPDLSGGVPVAQADWKSIGCDVCHEPVGNSYSTALSFWNAERGVYEPIKTSAELCAKCHAEQHGFGVIWEQSVSPAHKGWDCVRCHGSHNAPVKCIDCHDINTGRGAEAHRQHQKVDCTACHDAMKSVIWQDPYPDSRFFGRYFPQRTAHALRSWPSHNLQTQVDCKYCHHPQGAQQTTLASEVSCQNSACHPNGATFNWCPAFPRNEAPNGSTQ